MFHATMAAAIDGRADACTDGRAVRAKSGRGTGRAHWPMRRPRHSPNGQHGRRSAIREGIVPVGIPAGRASLFPPRRSVTSPDKAMSRDRRRLLACSGPMPPALASRFTTGQLAVLRIVADEGGR